MINFFEMLNLIESAGYTAPFSPVSNSWNSNKKQDFDSRVQSGKAIEQKIIDTLTKQYGWKIAPVTSSEDKYGKIDGWVTNAGKREALQIKYRDGGTGKNDILLEVIKPFYPEMFEYGKDIVYSGRDMKGNAKYYAVLAQNGTVIMIRDSQQLKNLAREMTEAFADEFSDSKGMLNERKWQDGCMLKIRPDPSTGVNKLVAFINPSSPELSYKQDYNLKQPIR